MTERNSVALETVNLTETVDSTHSTGVQLTPAGKWIIWGDVDMLVAVSQSTTVEAQTGSYALMAYVCKAVYSNGDTYISVERLGGTDGTAYYNLDETE